MIIRPGAFIHELADGRRLHLDRQYSLEYIEGMAAEMDRQGVSLNDVVEADAHSDGSITFATIDRGYPSVTDEP